jgi:hypothetical protein
MLLEIEIPTSQVISALEERLVFIPTKLLNELCDKIYKEIQSRNTKEPLS